jgi:Na+/proline symporter
VCYIAANFLALGLIIDAIFATGVTAGVWIGAAVVVAYSATGGMLAGMYTDLFQGLLMATASVLVFGAVLASGDGMASISHEILSAEPAWFGPWGNGTPLAALSFFFVFGLGTLGQPQVLHKFYMLRDPRQMRWYPLLMTGALMLTLLLFIGVGMAIKARVLSGDLPPLANADEATPTFLLRYTSVILAAVVFSGVAAAIMSTVNSFLSLAAAAITRDLTSVQRSDSGQLRLGRLATVVVALLAILLAARSGALIALLGVVGWGVFAATLVPSLAFGLAWRGATRAGAIASMVTGLLVTVVLEVLVWQDRSALPAGVSAAGIALLAAMLVFLGVSWLTRAQAAGDLDADVALVMER